MAALKAVADKVVEPKAAAVEVDSAAGALSKSNGNLLSLTCRCSDARIFTGRRARSYLVWNGSSSDGAEINACSMRRRLKRGNKTHNVDIGAVAEIRVNQASTRKLKRHIRCI